MECGVELEILGLDKIKHLDENSNVDTAEIIGLDVVRQIKEEPDIRQENDNIEKDTKGMEHTVLSAGRIDSGNEEVNITGLDKIRRVAEPELPKLSSFSVELISLVNKAKEHDKYFQVFGADKHRYRFNSVLPLSRVRDFEERHQIKLPQGYVDFLTQVGDGGAGPDLGLYSLDEVEFNNYTDHSPVPCSYEMIRTRQDFYTVPYTIENKEPLINSGLDEDKWFEWYENLGRACMSGKDHNRMATELYNGLLEISVAGGTSTVYLICTGDLKGRLAGFTLDIDDRVHIYDMTFEEWLKNHFIGIVTKFENKS